MFERFSGEARAAVVAAQQVARETGSRSIDSRHLVVALAEQRGPAATAMRSAGLKPDRVAGRLRAQLTTGSLDATALAGLGIDLDAVRERTDAVFGPGALDRAGQTPGHLPFTREAKSALERALRETVRLRHKIIDGRHLLLGVLSGECLGRDALAVDGTGLDPLRRALEDLDGPVSRSA